MRLIGGAAHGAAMAIAHAMPHIDEIKMRVDLHDMDRVLAIKRRDAGDGDRMITTQHHGHRTRRQNGAHAAFNVGVALRLIGVNDISIANINDAHIAG